MVIPHSGHSGPAASVTDGVDRQSETRETTRAEELRLPRRHGNRLPTQALIGKHGVGMHRQVATPDLDVDEAVLACVFHNHRSCGCVNIASRGPSAYCVANRLR